MFNSFTVDARTLGDFDVAVCGGGIAGVCAAISSARSGAKTILIERSGSLGGTLTEGFMPLILDADNKGGLVKELFAFLIDRKGAGMTAKQICAILFPDDTDDTKNSAYLRQLILDLKTTLKAVGAENVLCHESPYYRIDPKWVRCDYLSYLDTGKPGFHGEYMTQYSWAESTCAMLQFKNHY